MPQSDTLLTMIFRLRDAAATRLLLTACALVAASAAHAAELVTLRNGFTLNCSSREMISSDTVRLHLKGAGTALENYMDVPATAIVGVEAFMEPVPADNPRAVMQAKVGDVAGIVQQSGETHNLNVALLMAVIHAESAGNPHARSRSGARGLMQLMPGTAIELGVTDSFSPEANVNGGSAYLDRLLTRYHENIALALAAYNAGPAAVDRYHGMPPYRETQRYVAKVIRDWNNLVASQASLPASGRVASR